jgi:hypothetical protein
MYRHVDILNRNGLEAYVVHRTEGYSLAWFEHNTRIIYPSKFQRIHDPARDVVVVPEDLGHAINDMPGQKVICNQNCHYGFYAFGFHEPHPYPYLRADVKGVMTVSDHNQKYLAFAFPNLKTRRIWYSVDPSILVAGDIRSKKKKIACLPSKNEMDLSQVYHVAQSRAAQGLNRLGEYEWAFIQNRTEREVAAILRDSLILVFLSTTEGFGILPVEAMLCGSIVLGYRHGPLIEYLRPGNSYVSEAHDVLSVVRNLEEVTTLFLEDPERLRAVSDAARKTAGEYSCEREAASILDFWKEILPGE